MHNNHNHVLHIMHIMHDPTSKIFRTRLGVAGKADKHKDEVHQLISTRVPFGFHSHGMVLLQATVADGTEILNDCRLTSTG